jgi:hypothetical protein
MRVGGFYFLCTCAEFERGILLIVVKQGNASPHARTVARMAFAGYDEKTRLPGLPFRPHTPMLKYAT